MEGLVSLMHLKFSDVILMVIALVATGIILQFGLVYGEMFAWPEWHVVTQTDEPWLILREGV